MDPPPLDSSAGPPPSEPPSVGPPSAGPPLRRTETSPDRPKFRSLFSLSRRHFRSFSVSQGRRGFTRQPKNSKRAHLMAPALQTPPTFNEKTPRERQKERKWVREREKKAQNFWPPPFGPPPFGPHSSGSPVFSGFGPSPFEPLPRAWPTFQSPTMTHTRSNNGLTQIGFGQNWPGQNHDGQKRIGPNWSNQDGQKGIGQSRSLPADLLLELGTLEDLVQGRGNLHVQHLKIWKNSSQKRIARIHNIASDGKSEQEVAFFLNRIFPRNECG